MTRSPATILIVDDESQDRKLLDALLRPEGYLTRSAVSGEEALASIAERAPDLILLDLMMPGMDGYEVARRLKANPATSNIPIIMITVQDDRNARLLGLKAGAEDFLTKPIDRAELWLRVRNLLRLKVLNDSLQDHSSVLEQEVQTRTSDLHASELRFRQMAENIREVFWLTDPAKNQILYVSPAYEEIWGRSCESLYASPREWIDAIHPGDRERVLHAAQTKQASGAYVEEYRVVRPDGTTRWIRDRAFPVFRNESEVYRIAGLAEDITESRRVAEELRESERRFGDVLQDVELISLMLDTEANITYCNEYLLRLTDWRREDIIGRNWFELFIPPEINDLKDVHAALLASKPAARHHENEILTRSGERRLIRWNNSVLRSGVDDVIGTASIGEDITEQRRAETGIKRLNRVYAVLSGINALIVRVRDRDELFREACRIAVEAGGFRLSWIGIVDRGAMKIVPVASAGADSGFLEEVRARMSLQDDAPAGRGPPAVAVREKQAVIVNDMESDPRIHYRKTHADRGIRSLVILPVLIAGEPVAVLGLYAAEAGYFDEAEMKLLRELAGDIAFALENIGRQQKLDKLSRIRAVSSEINATIVRVRESKALLEETCRIVSEHGKFEMVWIGAIDHDAQQVQPIAWKGFSEETARAVNWASISSSKGTLGEAMQTRKASVRHDIEGELPGGKLRGEALKRGFRSTVCLPLVVGDGVTALVVLFATGQGFFDQDELALLDEVASDLSFALQAIEKQKKLEYLSYYDVLTGLANRSLLLERVAQHMRSAVSGGHKLALALVDLERFKNMNDSLGRPAGDALLRQVAEWLTRRVGDASLLARTGADHFAVVLPEVKAQGNLAGLIDKFVEAFLGHPFRLNGAVFRLALKMGVALFPDDGTDADTLFKNAEAALKKAKAGGDRYLFHTQKMTEAVAGKLTLENQLRQALDNEEFVLHYQPKVNLASGKPTGAEALIRWNDPRTGLVPPGQFIPILEETGLIFEVGRWALRRAIEDYLRWRAAGLAAVRIAVNVSPLQLRNRNFIAEIGQAIGIDPHAAGGLELEITEGVIMEDVQQNIATLQAIRAMGVRIAIDDFGTGFSSLSYLSKLPVDTLKIDRSFVIDMTAGPQGLALVSAIVTLGHSLKLNVVAEGVETEEQSRLLRLLGCDEMQGFLFSKPLPSEIFETRFLAPPPAGSRSTKIPSADDSSKAALI